jgi:hypothetical protein
MLRSAAIPFCPPRPGGTAPLRECSPRWSWQRLATCAAMGPAAAPEIVGANVRVVQVNLPEVTMAIDLTLSNPNAVEIVVKGVRRAHLARGRAHRDGVARRARRCPRTGPPA